MLLTPTSLPMMLSPQAAQSGMMTFMAAGNAASLTPSFPNDETMLTMKLHVHREVSASREADLMRQLSELREWSSREEQSIVQQISAMRATKEGPTPSTAEVEHERARKAAEQEQARVAAEQEQTRVAAEQQQARVAAEEEQARQAAAVALARQMAELEQLRQAAEQKQAVEAAEQKRAMEAAERERARETAAVQTVSTTAAEQERARTEVLHTHASDVEAVHATPIMPKMPISGSAALQVVETPTVALALANDGSSPQKMPSPFHGLIPSNLASGTPVGPPLATPFNPHAASQFFPSESLPLMQTALQSTAAGTTPLVNTAATPAGRPTAPIVEDGGVDAHVDHSRAAEQRSSSDVLNESAHTNIKCPALQKMASKLKLKAPNGGSWLAQFCGLLEQLSVASIVVDVRVPGLPITFANSASRSLVGYEESEYVGRNCRVLQGKRTEGAAVRQIVDTIRKRAAAILRITNYRKDGSTFKNVLALHPIFDSQGTYRYLIGLQADEVNFDREGALYEKVRKLLPDKFDVNAQQERFDRDTVTNVDEASQQRQWRQSIAKFTRLVWSMDWESTFDRLLEERSMFMPFFEWSQKRDSNSAAQLELCYRMAEMRRELHPQQQGPRALELCARYLGSQVASADDATQLLATQTSAVRVSLANELLPKFIQSKACLPLVEALTAGKDMQKAKADSLMWSEYTVPKDVAGWLYSFVPVAETYPACIVISDMLVPGNPMCFVNQEFCRVTGYKKGEVQGRNCRFLQGPRTEPQSVAVIQDTLRRGVDCHVRITNYRKSGEIFQNLLTMRPVHDTNGVYRFCIGVQFEVIEHSDMLAMLTRPHPPSCSHFSRLPLTAILGLAAGCGQ